MVLFRSTQKHPKDKHNMTRDWSNKKVLIAEDEQTNFLFLEAALEDTGLQISHATDGKEAVQLFQQNQTYDVVLMDLKMPFMNGFDATKKIKAINPDTPIIVQTAYAMDFERERIMATGCDDYITKPIDIEALLSLLDKWLTY